MTQLPLLVETYVHAANTRDAARLAACFQADGTVRDEGSVRRGREQIAAWAEETAARYGAVIEPLGATELDGTCRLQANVRGDFPGSPIVLAFDFVLGTDGIASLEIAP